MTDERLDQILRQTLSPEIPDESLNRNLKREMEEKKMKRFSVKKTVILAAACCLLVGTVCVASSGKVTSLVSDFGEQKFSSFSQLAEAEDKAGFKIKAVESFDNGYAFADMRVEKWRGEDEEGNVLERFKEIAITYKKPGMDALYFHAQEAAYSHDNESRVPDRTVGINGAEVKYYVDTYKWVPAGYELTAEDEKNMERSDYFISEGADEVSENKVSSVVWEQNGVRYSILNIKDATPAEVLFEMAEEVITVY